MKASIRSCLAATILAISCSTTPTKAPDVVPPVPAAQPAPAPATVVPAKPLPSAPVWVGKTTYVDGGSLIFVVTGPEKSDVTSLNLAAMTEYLNLPLKSTTPPPGVQAVQAFLKKMSATAPAERYLRNGQGWWKVVLSRDDWEKSRVQLAALVKEVSVDPLVVQEKAADDAVQQGRYFEAINQYVSAAQKAADGAAPRVDRYQALVTKAQAVLAQLTLSSATAPLATTSGQAFPAPVVVKLTYGSGSQAPAVPGAFLRFSYKAKVNGRVVTTGQSVRTDAQGQASLTLPVPDFGVKDNVVVLVDVNPWLEALAKVPQDLRDPVSKFEPLAADRKLLLPYTVESASKQIPLIIALADFDDRGGIVRRQETTAALISALQKAGFQASGLSINLSLLRSSSERVVLTAWRFQGKTTGLAVYGTVNLVSVVSADSQYTAEVNGTLKVVDLETSKPVYQYTNSKVVSAADKASAVTQSFRQWAADAADDLATSLP